MPHRIYDPRYTFADARRGVDYLAEAELGLRRGHALHAHAQMQVLWVIDGQFRMILEGVEHLLRPGHMCRVAPGQLHLVTKAAGGPVRARILDLRLTAADGALAGYVTSLGGGPVFPVDARQVAAVSTDLRQVVQDERIPGAAAAVQSLLWRLLAAIRHPAAESPAPVHPDRRLELAESYMRARMAHPIGVSDIARATHLSTSQLTRLYASIGTSPARRLRELRVERARQLLQSTTLSIKQIAHACGFVCPNHFSRAYVESTGTRPSADRR